MKYVENNETPVSLWDIEMITDWNERIKDYNPD